MWFRVSMCVCVCMCVQVEAEKAPEVSVVYGVQMVPTFVFLGVNGAQTDKVRKPSLRHAPHHTYTTPHQSTPLRTVGLRRCVVCLCVCE